MTEKAFHVAVILTVPADSYEEALEKAEDHIAVLEADSGIGVSVETNYEHDGSPANQRVFYLHSEDSPLEID